MIFSFSLMSDESSCWLLAVYEERGNNLLVDIHTHFVPEKLPDMSYKAGGHLWPRIETRKDGSKIVMIRDEPFRIVTPTSWDPDARKQEMDEEGVTIQVISPMPILLSYWFDAHDALEFSSFVNSALAEMVATDRERFVGFGTVPLQDPLLAGKVVKTLKREYGLLGVEIGSNVNGRVIGDPMFLPFFEAAAAEEMAILLHPLQPLGVDRIVGPAIYANIINFHLETALAVASLITGGVLDRYPNLKIVISHGGGSFFSILPRMIHGWKTFKVIRNSLSHSPLEYARRLYYDTLVYDELTLNHIIQLFGTERLMVGSDYPFEIREKVPGRAISHLSLADEERARICYRNALDFLGFQRPRSTDDN